MGYSRTGEVILQSEVFAFGDSVVESVKVFFVPCLNPDIYSFFALFIELSH